MRGGVLLVRLAHFRRRVRGAAAQVPEKYRRAAELQFGWTFNKVDGGLYGESNRVVYGNLGGSLVELDRSGADESDGVRDAARG